MAIPSKANRIRRALFVTGCARSGTLYVAKALRELGLRVGHEYVDVDGTVSHIFASGSIEYPVVTNKWPEGRCIHVGEHPSQFVFERTYHLMRHPLKVIDSLRWTGVSSSSLRAAGMHVPPGDAKLTRAVRYWYGWNKLCEKLTDQRVRIEDIDADPALLCAMAQVMMPRDGWKPATPTDTHHARRWWNSTMLLAKPERGSKTRIPSADRRRLVQAAPPTTWEEVAQADPEYCAKVRALAEGYGYTP
jgi:hypothetical protein